MLILSRSLTFLRKGGLSFVIFIKKRNMEGVRAIRAIKYKNYVAGKYTRARAPLARIWRGCTQIEYLSQKMAQQV